VIGVERELNSFRRTCCRSQQATALYYAYGKQVLCYVYGKQMKIFSGFALLVSQRRRGVESAKSKPRET
jgi:hypothetical protein